MFTKTPEAKKKKGLSMFFNTHPVDCMLLSCHVRVLE